MVLYLVKHRDNFTFTFLLVVGFRIIFNTSFVTHIQIVLSTVIRVSCEMSINVHRLNPSEAVSWLTKTNGLVVVRNINS